MGTKGPETAAMLIAAFDVAMAAISLDRFFMDCCGVTKKVNRRGQQSHQLAGGCDSTHNPTTPNYIYMKSGCVNYSGHSSEKCLI